MVCRACPLPFGPSGVFLLLLESLLFLGWAVDPVSLVVPSERWIHLEQGWLLLHLLNACRPPYCHRSFR